MHNGNVEPEPEPRPRTYDEAPRTADAKAFEESVRLGAQAGFLGLVFHSAFFLASTFRGPHWELRPHETQKLAADYTAMFNAVLPPEWLTGYNGILEKFGPVFAAGLTTISVIGPRLAIDADLNAIKNARVGVGAPAGAPANGAWHDATGFKSSPAWDVGGDDGSTDIGSSPNVP